MQRSKITTFLLSISFLESAFHLCKVLCLLYWYLLRDVCVCVWHLARYSKEMQVKLKKDDII